MATKNISYFNRFFLNPFLGFKAIKILPKSYYFFSLVKVIYDSFQFGKKYSSELKVKVGDTAPTFEIPNAIGNSVKLDDILQNQKVVLIFYRGGWCPFCNLWLREFQNLLPDFEKTGATLVAVSPQIPDKSLSTEEKLNLKFQVLSDIGNKVARQYTGILKYEGSSDKALKNIGVDLNEYNNEETGEVPIPAVFVIGQNKEILFADSEGGDYKKRVEPKNVLLALQQKD
ncbi:peroxiredoxin-like family protein [Flavobacterium aestivum]|uniref:peroxiredoxin-like family protein n=1 Tax=Flavobacterium aestivum TaxID=3003257 RepID=UPI0022862C64|nr:peroxiredoxin-like family protein [Flavobacterium aestivum]